MFCPKSLVRELFGKFLDAQDNVKIGNLLVEDADQFTRKKYSTVMAIRQSRHRSKLAE